MPTTAKHERDLDALEREFAAWRRKRRRGARIPEALWGRAVSLAQAYGLWKTKARLNLNYYALKRRSDEGALVAPKATRAKPVAEFVELPWSVDPGPECLLELDAGGVRLRVGLRGAGVEELEATTRLLWELGR